MGQARVLGQVPRCSCKSVAGPRWCFIFISLDKINCVKREYEQLRIIYMGPERKTIYDSDEDKHKYKPMRYRPIPANSFIELLVQALCVD